MKLIDFYTKEERIFNDKLNIYVCGPTVYNDAHIGNIRPILVTDLLTKVENTFIVHNITDIDDKIIAKAHEAGKSEKEISELYEKNYLDLLKELRITLPNEMPRVTDNIEGMIDFIAALIEKGFAYENAGSVYFSVNKLEKYGVFANLDIGANKTASSSDEKIEQEDFAIWKSTDEGIQFDSPWGKGRPGWHTECSYFIDKYFGIKGADIHGGGIDLKFPHHVNEMAQFEAYHGQESKNLWFYVGHITMNDEKMSKSIGNTILAKDFIKEYGYDVLRHLILSVNYLKPLNVNSDTIKNSVNAINKIKNSLVKATLDIMDEYDSFNEVNDEESISFLKDNLDTPRLITKIYKLVDAVNKDTVKNLRKENIELLLSNLRLIGIDYKIQINELKEHILKAKEEKDYETLDRLKGELIC